MTDDGQRRDRVDADRVPVRPDLADVEPYGAPQLDVPVRLNTNETAEPPPEEFTAALRDRLDRLELHRYPDREASAVRQRLAALEGLGPERVWAANGSNEILHHLLLAYGGPERRALILRPGYSLYPLLLRVTSTGSVVEELPGDLRLTPEQAGDAVRRERPDIVLVANPNNPTGVQLGRETVQALHDAGRALVVVDEAYVEFGAETVRPLLDVLPRLVVVRTFSKAQRLAGLRFGYLLAHGWVVDDLRRVRLPYHLDAVKQQAALTALDLGPAMLTHVPRVVAERERILGALRALDRLEVFPSSANFLLVRTEVTDLFDRLLDEGVLVRDFSDQPGLGGCVRVTIGTVAENDAFLAALRGVLESDPAGGEGAQA